MNEHVVNYINTEKDLAKYNILMLERGEVTPARKRLIEIEREFISIPFDKLGLQTVEEVASAIELYRQSRRLFYLKYDLNNSENIASKISKKLLFLDKVSAQFMKKRIQEINPVQDDYFFEELVSSYAEKNSIDEDQSRDIISHKGLEDLKSLEGAIIAKKRARLQVALYSLGLYIQKFLDEEIDFEKEINSDFNLVNSKIDNFIFTLDKYAFNHYNSSLSILPKKLAGTMGHNDYIERIYSLDNIFSLYNYTHTHTHVYTLGKKRQIQLDRPLLGNVSGYKNPIYKTYQRDADRQTKNRVYGIIFPIERMSREKMTPLHIEIYFSGINITELFCESISNIRVINEHGKEIYFKGILMKPLWELLNYASESLEYHYVVSKLLDESLNDISKFNDKKFITQLNAKMTPFLEIDLSSKILIPKTRSEEQYIEDIMPLLLKRIDVVKNDYKNII